MSKPDARKFVRDWYNETAWCHCGCPGATLRFVRAGLEIIGKPYEERVRMERETFGEHPGAAYFVYYVFDKLGLIEHGGSVPGWLDGKGERLLNALRLLTDEELDEVLDGQV